MSAFSVTSYASSTPSSAPSFATVSTKPSLVAQDEVPVSNLQQVDKVAPAELMKPAEENAKLDQAVATINQFLKPIASSVQFSVDEDSGRTLVKVIDTDTNNVLRQFPSKQALAISNELGKLQGLLLKDQA